METTNPELAAGLYQGYFNLHFIRNFMHQNNLTIAVTQAEADDNASYIYVEEGNRKALLTIADFTKPSPAPSVQRPFHRFYVKTSPSHLLHFLRNELGVRVNSL